MMLLDRSGCRATDANTIAAHDKRRFFPLGVEKISLHSLRILSTQLKNVPNFDAALSAALQGSPWARVKVPSVVLGPLRVAPAAGWTDALDDASLTRHGMRRDGVLGHEAFRGWRVTFDWRAHVLRLHASK